SSANGKAPDEADIPADTMKAIREGVADGRRSDVFWNIVIALKRLDFTIEGMVALFERYPEGIAKKYEGRLRQEVERAYNKIKVGVGTEADAEIELVCASDVEMKAVDWEWSNHLARGKVTFLAGDSGLAKSLMTTDFAARITKVGEWPDGDEAP